MLMSGFNSACIFLADNLASSAFLLQDTVTPDRNQYIELIKPSIWIIAGLFVIIFVWLMIKKKIAADEESMKNLKPDVMREQVELLAAAKKAERKEKQSETPPSEPSTGEPEDNGFVEGQSLAGEPEGD